MSLPRSCSLTSDAARCLSVCPQKICQSLSVSVAPPPALSRSVCVCVCLPLCPCPCLCVFLWFSPSFPILLIPAASLLSAPLPLPGMLCGSVCGATAAVLTCPMDVIKTRLIAHSKDGAATWRGLNCSVTVMRTASCTPREAPWSRSPPPPPGCITAGLHLSVF